MNAKKEKAIRAVVKRIGENQKLAAFGLLATPQNPTTVRVNPHSARGLTRNMKKTATVKKGGK